jgi:hypothetical protein
MSETDDSTANIKAITAANQRAQEAELRCTRKISQVEILKDKINALEASEKAHRMADAEQAVSWMVKSRMIKEFDSFEQDTYKQKFIADPTLIPLLAGKNWKTK